MALLNSVGLGVLVFLLALVVDAFFVVWTLASNRRQWVRAGVAALGIQVAGWAGLLMAIDERWLVVVNSLGHAAGSALAVLYSVKRDRLDGGAG